MSQWRDLADRLDGKAPPGTRRSSSWRRFRDDYLRGKVCAVCGGKRSLSLHHLIPFHLAPDLECDPRNVLPLCEAGRYGINCHLLIGHLGNWQRFNVSCEANAVYWHQRLILDR